VNCEELIEELRQGYGQSQATVPTNLWINIMDKSWTNQRFDTLTYPQVYRTGWNFAHNRCSQFSVIGLKILKEK
jgi:hypothetical protein